MKISKRFQGKHGKKLTVAAAAAVGLALCLLCAIPRAAVAAATQRDLPIYCVQKDSKVCSLTFDAAWGNVKVRQAHIPWSLPHFLCFHYHIIDVLILQESARKHAK